MNKKPNFLILLPDQFRYDAFGAAGSPHMKTPNIDRIASEGCRFTNAYAPNPICVPARHCLLTGTTSRSHGYCDNAAQNLKDSGLPTFPRALSENGYHTAVIGKCHFHPVREHHGYNEMHLMEELPESVHDDAYASYLAERGRGDVRNIHGVRVMIYHESQQALVPAADHGTNWIADRAIEWLDKNHGRPFLLNCGWIAPHPPFNNPPECEALYDGVDLPDPAPKSRPAPYSNDDSPWYGDSDTPEVKRKIRQSYFAAASMVDAAIGRVMAHLEKLGILDNTFIIFASDHGEMLQDKGFYQKALPFDSAAKIPFLIRYPERFKPGSTDGRLVDLMDVFPTLLEAAGIDLHYKESHKKYSLCGSSLLPDSALPARDRQYQWVECLRGQRRWVSLRDERYKYVHYYNGNIEMLYDLQNDPREITDLVSEGRAPQDVVTRLRAKCLEKEAALGLPGSVENGDFKKYPHDPEIFSPPGWDSGAKRPRWCYAQGAFQDFGKKTPAEEAAIFLDELRKSVAHQGGAEFLKSIPCLEPGRSMVLESFAKLGGDPAELEKLLG